MLRPATTSMELERHTELSSSGGGVRHRGRSGGLAGGSPQGNTAGQGGGSRSRAVPCRAVCGGLRRAQRALQTTLPPASNSSGWGSGRGARAVLLSNVPTHTFENGVPVVCQRTEQRGSERPLIAFGAGDVYADADATRDRDADPAVTARERNRMMGDDQASPRVNRRNGAESTGDRSNHPETEREGPGAPETDAAPCAPSCEEDTRLDSKIQLGD
mmetsp:Transcript_12644/g.35838  ORF Transcript_12644/g.35838 Transcript_12644/m.35838 type:complete len:216 (+) Transcript_12644:366-1013(+)